MSTSVWGSTETQYFYEITPDRVFKAVERVGFECTGYCTALNSFENRVYEIEIEVDRKLIKSPSERFRIVKFYRPGRWNREQILEEHLFLKECVESEIPVIAPLEFKNGGTLESMDGTGIFFTVFPKVGGRSPDELTDEQLERIGRLLARIHNVGANHPSQHRITLSVESHALEPLDFLLKNNFVPEGHRTSFETLVKSIAEKTRPLLEKATFQRVHGDCHYGNLLWNPQGPFFLDFDDMICAPCIQDLWLVVRGRDEEAKRQFEVLLQAYEQMRKFDRSTLALIEPLRSLRMIHFMGWVARRWSDPAFPRAFPDFGTPKYWDEKIQDLKEQVGFFSN